MEVEGVGLPSTRSPGGSDQREVADEFSVPGYDGVVFEVSCGGFGNAEKFFGVVSCG